jgi:hypothetical protein
LGRDQSEVELVLLVLKVVHWQQVVVGLSRLVVEQGVMLDLVVGLEQSHSSSV